MTTILQIKTRAKSLEKERDHGNIEYKWKLVDIDTRKKTKLATQMNYRLTEGNGKSMYAIGFLDNGYAVGISEEDMNITLQNIYIVIDEINADIHKILLFNEDDNFWAKLFVHKRDINKDIFM